MKVCLRFRVDITIDLLKGFTVLGKMKYKWGYLEEKEGFVRMTSSISRIYKQAVFFSFRKNNPVFSGYLCIYFALSGYG